MESAKLEICAKDGGLIQWTAIVEAIDRANDIPTLSRLRDALQALKSMKMQRQDAILCKNRIARYLDEIEDKRYELKIAAGVRKGGSKLHSVTLEDVQMTKRESANLNKRHAIPKSTRLAYFDECDAAAREIKESGLLRYYVVPRRKPSSRLPEGQYSLILANPDWHHERGNLDTRRPASAARSILEMAPQIKELSAPGCVLLLWSPPDMVDRGLEVLEAWGFRFCSTWVWNKADIYGAGHGRSDDHEELIFGARGLSTPATVHKLIHSISSVQSFSSRGLRPTQKPQEYYEIFERLWPKDRKIEVFAIDSRPGWACWAQDAQDQTGDAA